MPALLSAPLDMVEELTYRCWARRNYLPLELREADWHPVIHEEMAARDRELLEMPREEEARDVLSEVRFVPLLPTVTQYVHPAQPELREPHFLNPAETAASLYTNSIYAGGLF